MVKRNGYQNRCGEESISARAVRTKKIVWVRADFRQTYSAGNMKLLVTVQ